MLIIEGTDDLGKTTLAQKLWEVHDFQSQGYEIQHLSKLPEGHDRRWHYVRRMNRRGIFDRFWLSEVAYARARGDSHIKLTPECQRVVEGYAATLGAFTVLVYCHPIAFDQIMAERQGKDEMYDMETIAVANEQFFSMRELADYKINLTPASPWPTDEDVHNITTAYFKRQWEIQQWQDSKLS